MESFESSKIKVVLKTTLKNQAKTYEQLAEHLKCSVSTVKRFMGKEDISLSRLLKICDFLQITFGDLEQLTNNIKNESFRFNPEQFDFLKNRPGHFAFLMQLLDDKSLGDLKSEFNLNQTSINKYLIDLEKIELLEAEADEIKIKCKGLTLDRESKLAKVYLGNCIKASCDMFKDIITEKENLNLEDGSSKKTMTYSNLVLKLSEASLEEWIEEQDRSFESLRQKSNFEKVALSSEEIKTIVISRATYATNEGDRHLKKFNEVWGEIKNI